MEVFKQITALFQNKTAFRQGKMVFAILIVFLGLTLPALAETQRLEGEPGFRSPETPKDRFIAGLSFYRNGNFSKAIDYFEGSLEGFTDWQEYPYFYLICAHFKKGQAGEVLGLCKSFKRRFPGSPLLNRVTFLEAQAYHQKAAYWLASRSYEKVLKEMDQAEIRLKYGEILEALDRLSEAYANYQRIRRKWPTSAEAGIAKIRVHEMLETPALWMKKNSEISCLVEEAELCLAQRLYAEAFSLYEQLLAKPLTIISVATRQKAFLGRIQALLGQRQLLDAHSALLLLMENYPDSKEAVEGLYYIGREYWRKDLNEQAVPLLNHLLNRYPDASEAVRAAYILGRIYSEGERLEPAIKYYGLAQTISPRSTWAAKAAWGEAWCYYLQGQYETCAAFLKRGLSRRIWGEDTSRALYWQARCLEKTGQIEESRNLYHIIKSQYLESYYFLLAEWRLSGKSLTDIFAPQAGILLKKNGLTVSTQGAFELLSDPVISLLIDADLPEHVVERLDRRYADAKKNTKLTREDWAAAYYAVGEYAKAIRIAWQGQPLAQVSPEEATLLPEPTRRLLWLLYPLPYWDHIERYALERGLDPLFVAGLMRQESMFMDDVVSSAGAVGLMQIMPNTGRQVAEQIGLMGFKAEWLKDPEVNINIGTAYLADLAEHYQKDWVKIFATYNAGPQAVAKWKAFMPNAEPDEFVEIILYRETRGYVKKVLYNWALYKKIYSSFHFNNSPGYEIPDHQITWESEATSPRSGKPAQRR